MKSSLKILIFFIVLVFSTNISFAYNLQIQRFSTPIKIPNKISQPINITFTTNGNWKLFAEPLDNQIRNIDNPNYTLPITRLELTQIGGMPLSHFDMGKSYEIKNGVSAGMQNINLALNVLNFDADYPGNYLTDIKFTLIDNDSMISEEIYTFRFEQEPIVSVDFSNRNINLKFEKDKILQKNSSQNLSYPFSVYISSNKDWKLFLRSNQSNDKNLRYFVKTLNGGDNSIEYIQSNEYIAMNQNQILIAKGKSTINQNTNSLDKKIINIDYLVKGPEDRFIPSGSTTEQFEYILETED
jgi:hypothetical protein